MKNTEYFANRPDVVKIFDDLEDYLNFCRFELLPYNQADLYNKKSPTWQQYITSTKTKNRKQKT